MTREPTYDDNRCTHCSRLLPASPPTFSWADHGFCHAGCMVAYPSGVRVYGHAARELAERDGKRGGPGFELPLIREWLSFATPEAPYTLARLCGTVVFGPSYADSWVWQLWAGGELINTRLTAKVTPMDIPYRWLPKVTA